MPKRLLITHEQRDLRDQSVELFSRSWLLYIFFTSIPSSRIFNKGYIHSTYMPKYEYCVNDVMK